MREPVSHWIAGCLVRKPRLVLAVGLAVTMVAGWFAAGLEFDSSYFALLPPDDPEVRMADEVRELTGGHRQVVVAIEGGDADRRLEFGRELAARAVDLEQVRWAEAQIDVSFFEERLLWLIDEETLRELAQAIEEAVRLVRTYQGPFALELHPEQEQQEIQEAWERVEEIARLGRGGLTLPSFASDDGRYSFVLITPSVRVMDMEGSNALFAGLDRIVQQLQPSRSGLEVRYAGKYMLVRQQHQTITRDLQRATVLALVLCIVLVAAFGRRPAAPLVVGCSVLVGVVWSMGVARLLVDSLNVITGLLFAVLIGLGIDFGIHLLIRYQQERRMTRLDAETAVVRTVQELLAPSLTAALTTASAFLVLCTSSFRGFSEFGLIAAVGVGLTLVSSFAVVPPLLLLLDRRTTVIATKGLVPTSCSKPFAPGGDEEPESFHRRSRLLHRVFAIVILATMLTWAVYGALQVGDLPFRNDYRLLRAESDSTDFFAYVDDNLGFRFDPTVLVFESLDDLRQLHEIVEAGVSRGPSPGHTWGIDRVFSAVELLPRQSPERTRLVESIQNDLENRLLRHARGEAADRIAWARELTRAVPWNLDDLPDALRRRVFSLDSKRLVALVWCNQRIESDIQALGWAAQLSLLQGELDRAGASYLLSGETVMPAWVHRLIVSEAPRLFFLAALVVLAIVAVHRRSLGQAIVLCVPLAVAVLSTVGVMAALDLDLDMFNLVVIPAAIGIGIDDVVHIGHRYSVLGPGSIRTVLRRTGVAVLLTTLTTAAGFGSALVSHHGGLRSLAVLAIIAIAFAFLAATLFLPCLITLFELARPPRPKGVRLWI